MGIQYMTPKEYAELWRVHYNTVYRWIATGILPGVIKQRIFIRWRYYIPVDTIPPRPYPGPKPERRAEAVRDNLCEYSPTCIHPSSDMLHPSQREEIPGQLSVDDLPWTE